MTEKAPSSPRDRLGIRFSLLARRWRRTLDAHLATLGLTSAVWVPLIHLHQSGGGITQKELALRVGVDGSSLVRIIDILVRQGLVERHADESDGRARLIHLTEAGLAQVHDIQAELTRAETGVLADLTDDEIVAILSSFEKIDRRLAALEVERRDMSRK